jgi:hypothetical protein
MPELIAKEFLGYFRSSCESVLVNQDVEKKRIFFLRPSALPFCALRRFLTFAEEGIKLQTDAQAAKMYYTSVGITTHTVFERIIGRGGRIIGNWRCHACGFTRELQTYRVCKKCKGPMQYEEVELSKGSWRGHLDNIYVAKNGEWWIIDYKTCRADFIFKKQYGAAHSYIEQQNHYLVLLEEKLGKKIAGWMLVYLARENPLKMQRIVQRRMNEETKAKMLQENKLYSRLHKKIFLIKDITEVKSLYRTKRCGDIREHDRIFRFNSCKYKDVCFNEKTMIDRVRIIMKNNSKLPLIQFMPKNIRKELYGSIQSTKSSI